MSPAKERGAVSAVREDRWVGLCFVVGLQTIECTFTQERTPILDGMDLSIPPPLSLFGVHIQGHGIGGAVLFHQFCQGTAGFFGEFFGIAFVRGRLAGVLRGRLVRSDLAARAFQQIVVVIVAVDQLDLLPVVRQLAGPELFGFDSYHRCSGRSAGLLLQCHAGTMQLVDSRVTGQTNAPWVPFWCWVVCSESKWDRSLGWSLAPALFVASILHAW